MANTKIDKSISIGQAILSSLWHEGVSELKYLLSRPYKGFRMYQTPSTLRSSINRLHKQGLIEKRGRSIFGLTPKGEKEALFAYLNLETAAYRPEVPSKWDGGWRIIFFDIPETKRRHRDFLRRVLKTIGFKEFQKSVWIYPHPVPSFLRDLLFEENIKHHTRFITTENIEYDQDLRKLFPDTFFKNTSSKT